LLFLDQKKKKMLQELCLKDFENSTGKVQDIYLSFQQFGQNPKTAPVVLINHALTGNSQITGHLGWWTKIVGPEKCIDTNKFSILAFNIPGNGFNGKKEHLIEN